MTYSVQASLVLPWYAFWKAFCQVDAGFLFASRSSEHQGRFEVIVATDGAFFVTSIDEKLLNRAVSMSSSTYVFEDSMAAATDPR